MAWLVVNSTTPAPPLPFERKSYCPHPFDRRCPYCALVREGRVALEALKKDVGTTKDILRAALEKEQP